jgi:hypothetical protein
MPSTLGNGGCVVKSSLRILLLSLVAVWAGHAGAQAAGQGPLSDCPALPEALAQKIRWEVLKVPNMLLCRGLFTDSGEEGFALTISEESPFKPRRGDRAEVGSLDGREVQWYRTEIAGDDKAQAREALIRVAANQVVHISMRAPSTEALLERQQMVLLLPFPAYRED